jgi:hypothetical protein
MKFVAFHQQADARTLAFVVTLQTRCQLPTVQRHIDFEVNNSSPLIQRS